MKASRIAALQAMPIFGGLRADVLDRVVEAAKVVTTARGEYFFHEGDKAESMFVLEAGEVALLRHSAGEHYVLGQLRAGDCFGEMALFDLFPRSASVVATAPCTAIELSTTSLTQLFEADLEQFALFHMNVARELSRRLRAANDLQFRAYLGEKAAKLP